MKIIIKKLYAVRHSFSLFLVVLFLVLSPTISLAQYPSSGECQVPDYHPTYCSLIMESCEREDRFPVPIRDAVGNITSIDCRAEPPSPPTSPPTPAGPFVPLVGIPGVEDDSDLGTYINALYILSISLAALLAVIKIIVAGVKWMMTDIVTGKEEAKKDIQGALTGLLIVISAVVILTLINPNLTNINLALESGAGVQTPRSITATGCEIPVGEGGCDVSVTWSTQNNTAPSIRYDNIEFSTAAAGTNHKLRLTGSRSTVRLSVHDGDTEVASTPANISCADGSSWKRDTNTCVAEIGDGGASGTMVASSNSCTIPVGGNECPSNITITWDTTDATSPLVEHNGFRVSGPGASGSIQASGINPARNRFNLRNNDSLTGALLSYVTIQVTCAGNSTWNGTSCQ
ncbi:MAG TPA: pilin [Candidatus Paceibacterota bacterium]|nr:pilin [Candidatus Paceibacterota bacterium]HMO82615.1 pilin [Candidatus Paceibacterota bacterium]